MNGQNQTVTDNNKSVSGVKVTSSQSSTKVKVTDGQTRSSKVKVTSRAMISLDKEVDSDDDSVMFGPKSSLETEVSNSKLKRKRGSKSRYCEVCS